MKKSKKVGKAPLCFPNKNGQRKLCFVTVQARPWRRASVQAGRVVNGQGVRQEDGCLAYEYYRSAEDTEKILLLERWESPFHQKVHMSQPHMAELSQLKNSYISDVQLQRLSLM